MPDHIVASFDADLRQLRSAAAEMGGICEKMLAEAVTALVRRDAALAQEVIKADARLDALQREVEEKAIMTIARRQPMAMDLRDVVSAIRISGDLERIGDLAKNCAKRTLAIADGFQAQRIVTGLQNMADLVMRQLTDVLDAYAQRDLERAMDVWRRDGSIDALYTSLFRELLTYMMEDPRNITFCAHLLFYGKNVERIGDHTTNIAETVHYLVTGQALSAERPKDDRASQARLEPDQPAS
ncbi:phosphate signaling complex protein PhoU [Enterovirga sp.]|uniref:phosphate signaling complex protein PhoU n=1 Tax=Enterovirga sp. TaxID=2026350 RepID=UPI00261A1040|nr:phosphate signaling complex protein PhoU [Enterovirga sp.]MDB5592015.1 phosphate uptake regulator, PhoU [Enterovirga sp.]